MLGGRNEVLEQLLRDLWAIWTTVANRLDGSGHVDQPPIPLSFTDMERKMTHP